MQDIPVPTLNIYNLLTYNQEPPNFVIFPKIYVKTIWYDMSLFIRLMLPWQLYFDRHFFHQIEFSCFVMKYNLIAVTFYIFRSFKCSFVGYSVPSWSLVVVFGGCGNIKKN